MSDREVSNVKERLEITTRDFRWWANDKAKHDCGETMCKFLKREGHTTYINLNSHSMELKKLRRLKWVSTKLIEIIEDSQGGGCV